MINREKISINDIWFAQVNYVTLGTYSVTVQQWLCKIHQVIVLYKCALCKCFHNYVTGFDKTRLQRTELRQETWRFQVTIVLQLPGDFEMKITASICLFLSYNFVGE